jgi:hypothetical protein
LIVVPKASRLIIVGEKSHTLGLLSDNVLNVVLRTGTKNISQALGALHSLCAQVGIIIIIGLLAVANEVDGLGRSQSGSNEKEKSGLHFLTSFLSVV